LTTPPSFKISVVIPVKNGAATLKRCLDSLRGQTIGKELEIIVLDSMSTDASAEIAASYGSTIIAVVDGSFDHGLTRNIGVAHSSGELVYLTVQDAWISGNDLLERMAGHFSDTAVIAVVGHQAVPHEKDKNPVEWYRPVSEPGVTEKRVSNQAAFLNMPQKEQQSLVSWDNVVAMYRRSALLEQPFEKTAFAEDWIWTYQALQRGWKLLHDSSIVVYHYHHHTFDYSFRTSYTIHYHFYKFFGYVPSLGLSLMQPFRVSYNVAKNKSLKPAEKLYWIGHNCLKNIAKILSILNFLIRLKIGGKDAVEGGYIKYCNRIPQGRQKKSRAELHSEKKI
jgi:rhamnosyltransferase